MFDQDPRHVRKLLAVLRIMDEKYKEDADKLSKEAKLDREQSAAVKKTIR